MDFKELATRIFGIGFMGLSFLSLFAGILLFLAPYELDSLHSTINTQYPDKLVGVLDIAVPQISNITLAEVKTFCIIRGAFNLSIPLDTLPLDQQDITVLCADAGKAASMDELKKSFVTYKFTSATDAAFLNIRKQFIEPYAYIYIPVALVLFLAFYFFSALALYFSGRGVVSWLRTLSFHTATYAIFYVFALGISWLLIPSVVSSTVMQNPQLAQALSQIPAQQAQLANIVVSEFVITLTVWVQGSLVHVMAVYGAVAIIVGLLWAAFTVAGVASAKRAKGKENSESQQPAPEEPAPAEEQKPPAQEPAEKQGKPKKGKKAKN